MPAAPTVRPGSMAVPFRGSQASGTGTGVTYTLKEGKILRWQSLNGYSIKRVDVNTIVKGVENGAAVTGTRELERGWWRYQSVTPISSINFCVQAIDKENPRSGFIFGFLLVLICLVLVTSPALFRRRSGGS